VGPPDDEAVHYFFNPFEPVIPALVAFIASTGTRFGMDVANVRLVAILVGRGESGRTRPLVRTSAIIAGVISVLVGAAVQIVLEF